ncbi:MAG TPA: ABC transporter substrate-binding protein [Gaiellaceae bacterium]|nr:ABC transporter substrate-binding protein [Gaiellaceae bacterium]
MALLTVALVAVSLSAAAAHRGGRAHRGKAYPQRIVSLSPTVTEDLYAIGAGKQVVAVDQDSDYPRRAPRTALSGLDPNVEAIATYHPDLVVISYGGAFVHQLEQLGIRVVDEPAAKSVLGAYQEIKQLGRMTGHVRRARALVRSMARRLRAIVRSVPESRRHLRVYHELDPTYYSATSQTFIGRIYGLFGFRNIADRADTAHTGYPQLSAEYILQANPQIIVLADSRCCGQTPAKVAARPGWKTIAAVKDHRVIRVNDDIASRWGPRIVDFAAAVARVARRR